MYGVGRGKCKEKKLTKRVPEKKSPNNKQKFLKPTTIFKKGIKSV